MRTYEKTHPWLRFEVNLDAAPHALWVMLGECQSKCEHLTWVPLRPDVAWEMHQVYLAKGTRASAAIEGNTLTQEQVEQHLRGELRLPPSRQYLAREVDNIIEACNEMEARIRRGETLELTVPRVLELQRKVFKDLEFGEEGEPQRPGEIRRGGVGVGTYLAPPPEDCEHLLSRLCEWLDGMQAPEETKRATAIIKAILAHLYIAWLHPFPDGNGRTARLLEFQILVSAGIPTPACHLLSNHYNETRTEYCRQLDRASRSGGDVIPFLQYAVQGLLDGLKGQLEFVRRETWDVVWRTYVHERLEGRQTEAWKRRERLLLAISESEEAIPIADIPFRNRPLAEAYARKTPKTLTRDINELSELGLLERVGRRVRARREIILAFLPTRARGK